MSKYSAKVSTTLPLPSSPHWAPTTTTFAGMLILFTSSEYWNKQVALLWTFVLDSYRQTLCRLSHTFLRYRPFRLSTLDCLRRAENFNSVWLVLHPQTGVTS